jgi:hypothetical protein
LPACDERALELEQMIPYSILGLEPAYRGLLTDLGFANVQVHSAVCRMGRRMAAEYDQKSCFRSGASESSPLLAIQ